VRPRRRSWSVIVSLEYRQNRSTAEQQNAWASELAVDEGVGVGGRGWKDCKVGYGEPG